MLEVLQYIGALIMCVVFGFIGFDFMLCFFRTLFTVQWISNAVIYVLEKLEK